MAKTIASKSKVTAKDESALIVPNTKITITFLWKEIAPVHKKALARLAKRVNVSGFRKGTVPPAVAEEHLDKQALVEQTLQKLLPERYTKEVTDQKKKPLTTPEFQLISADKGKDWVVEAQIAEKSELSIAGFQSVVKNALKEAATESKKQKTKPKEQEERTLQLQFIYSKLAEKFRPQVPELLVKREIEEEVKNMREQLTRLNLTLADYIKRNGLTEEQFSQQITVRAVTRLQSIFLTDAVAKSEKITVSDKNIDAKLDTLEDTDFVKKERNNPDYRANVHQALFTETVHNFLLKI